MVLQKGNGNGYLGVMELKKPIIVRLGGAESSQQNSDVGLAARLASCSMKRFDGSRTFAAQPFLVVSWWVLVGHALESDFTHTVSIG